jgi:hypothetical protein
MVLIYTVSIFCWDRRLNSPTIYAISHSILLGLYRVIPHVLIPTLSLFCKENKWYSSVQMVNDSDSSSLLLLLLTCNYYLYHRWVPIVLSTVLLPMFVLNTADGILIFYQTICQMLITQIQNKYTNPLRIKTIYNSVLNNDFGKLTSTQLFTKLESVI